MSIQNEDIIIIGAGITGLHLAQCLKLRGQGSLILEKSKGLGGRVATRRIDELGLDHGAAFIEGKFFHGGMNSFAKELGKNLNVLKSQKVQTISKTALGWNLQTEEGLSFSCKKLIITAPLPQALELLSQNSLNPLEAELEIKYSKAIIYLAILNKIPAEALSTTMENHQFLLMRERELHPRGLVIQLSQDFSEKHFEKSEEEILSLIGPIWAQSPFSEATVEKFELKKWRYSRPLSNYSSPYVEIHPGLFLCGDAFGSPFASAEALAQVL
jgi:predicted NAD/FAD-dependent oxidoreductase